MIGNDLVDLDDPEAREDSLHPRFDERVFTPQERRFMASSECSGTSRWLLWACKESAYKLVRRSCGRVPFSPRAFQVAVHSCGRAQVTHDHRSVSIRIHCLGSVVHAIATWSWDIARSVLFAVGPADCDPSDAVRRLARTHIACHLSCSVDQVSIEADIDRIPTLTVAGQEHFGFLSISHHGSFVAFAWLPDPGGSHANFYSEGLARWMPGEGP